MTTYKISRCCDCPLAQDHMHESYCGPLMADSVDDDEFTIKDDGDPPLENCPLRKGNITIQFEGRLKSKKKRTRK